MTKRNLGVAADHLRFSHALTALTEHSESTYAVDTNDVPLLNEGIKSTAKHLGVCQSLLEDEAHAWDDGMLEDLKKQRDTLVSVRDMFERQDRYAKDNIPQLERRIQSNENKLAGLMGRPEGAPVKPGEQEKLEQAVRAVSGASSSTADAIADFDRTNNRLWTSTLAESSSRSVSVMSLSSSSNRSTMSVGCIKIGARNGSSTQSCRLTIGERLVKRSRICRLGSSVAQNRLL